MPPNQIAPTYHTAIWLEDQNGHQVFIAMRVASQDRKLAAGRTTIFCGS
jgi:hypothetical protein